VLEERTSLKNGSGKMLQVTLDPAMEKQLTEIALRVGQAPDELARRALLAYLEDLEDYATAVEAWKEHDPTQTRSSEEVLRELGLED
jgi:predicted DNA-binding protein